jgi:hypothetical protein
MDVEACSIGGMGGREDVAVGAGDMVLAYWACEPLTSSAARAAARAVVESPLVPISAGAESCRLRAESSGDAILGRLDPPSPVPPNRAGESTPYGDRVLFVMVEPTRVEAEDAPEMDRDIDGIPISSSSRFWWSV